MKFVGRSYLLHSNVKEILSNAIKLAICCSYLFGFEDSNPKWPVQGKCFILLVMWFTAVFESDQISVENESFLFIPSEKPIVYVYFAKSG